MRSRWSPTWTSTWFALGIAGFAACIPLSGAPAITRLTPPSALFSYNDPAPPHISRFLPGQRFDLQATVRPDPGQTIVRVEFLVDDVVVPGSVALASATALGGAPVPVVATLRATSRTTAGVRRLTARAIQSNGAVGTANGSFEIVALPVAGPRARNVIIMIGDGMGIAHRTAARVMLRGVSQGKPLAPLAVDTFPSSALVTTASLNSIITDSSAGASVYSTGNKGDNGNAGVFPDDTRERFDNPRVELIGEYLARTQGKWLGIVTTADVTDATPSAFAAHAQDRLSASGIADGYLDEAASRSNLRVLLGGGRRWFMPNSMPGSTRTAESDALLPSELATGWSAPVGALDPSRDLLSEFRSAGFTYAATRTQLNAVAEGTVRLLGLFNLVHINAAMDRIYKRRGRSTVVDDFGFPDQPMLDEMTNAALAVLKQNSAGFVLMVEGALIDKQTHAMDTVRWLHEMAEFDRAVARVKAFAQAVPDTLVIVTSDHETGGVSLVGTSRLTQAEITSRAAAGGGVSRMRDEVVIASAPAGFPSYTILPDGYPETADVNRRMIIGYAANADRFEDWQTQPKPTGAPTPPGYPATPLERVTAGGFLVTGQIPGTSAAHTGNDIPLSALGVGAAMFGGVLDNTDVFFRVLQAAVGGAGTTGPGDVKTGAAPAPTSQRTASDRVTNVSSRGLVGGGEGALLSGFVVSGSRPHRFLIRGVGPALLSRGVTNALRDPVIQVVDAAGAVMAINDNWEASDDILALAEATTSVAAFPLATGSRDAALLIELQPGAYTVHLNGVDGATGVGLLEIYELP